MHPRGEISSVAELGFVQLSQHARDRVGVQEPTLRDRNQRPRVPSPEPIPGEVVARRMIKRCSCRVQAPTPAGVLVVRKK